MELTERIDAAWMKGKLGGKEGIFPADFVNVIVDLPPKKETVAKKTPSPPPTAVQQGGVKKDLYNFLCCQFVVVVVVVVVVAVVVVCVCVCYSE